MNPELSMSLNLSFSSARIFGSRMVRWMMVWVLGLGLAAGPVQAEDAGEAEETVTEITSKTLVFDYAEKLAVFTGDVVVTDPDMQLTAEVLRVYLTAGDEIQRIEAEGDVIIKMEGMHSQSGHADYVPGTGVLVLTRQPQVSREGAIMQAVKFTYHRLEDRLEADGQVRLLNFQTQTGGDREQP